MIYYPFGIGQKMHLDGSGMCSIGELDYGELNLIGNVVTYFFKTSKGEVYNDSAEFETEEIARAFAESFVRLMQLHDRQASVPTIGDFRRHTVPRKGVEESE